MCRSVRRQCHQLVQPVRRRSRRYRTRRRSQRRSIDHHRSDGRRAAQASQRTARQSAAAAAGYATNTQGAGAGGTRSRQTCRTACSALEATRLTRGVHVQEGRIYIGHAGLPAGRGLRHRLGQAGSRRDELSRHQRRAPSPPCVFHAQHCNLASVVFCCEAINHFFRSKFEKPWYELTPVDLEEAGRHSLGDLLTMPAHAGASSVQAR